MKVFIKKLNDLAVIPTRGSEEAAGSDLYANLGAEGRVMAILPGETAYIHTGLAMEIQDGCAGFIYARSGLAAKRGLRPANCVGVIDSDYRGEIIVALHNDDEKLQTVQHGDRIAQIVFAPYLKPEYVVLSELSATERGDGGFGHTGK